MPDSAGQYHVAIAGGGLAGLATAVALGSAGYRVTVCESRPFLGGRATSYPLNSGDDEGPTIDNCQHILLRCCTNLIDFYRRLGVDNDITFYRDFHWIEPGGRQSVMRRGLLPAPFHFAESFATLQFLSWPSKLAIGRAMLAVRSEYEHRADLDRVTMLDWLREKKQPEQAVERFWRQVLVSAVNEDLERMAASHGLQVFAIGFLSRSDAYEMGVPNVPLARLYSGDAWRRFPTVQIQERYPIERVVVERGTVACLQSRTGEIRADAYVLAVPFERLPAISPDLALDLAAFAHSPITGIHLWFDRPITNLPHATLLDRTIQWLFNKEEGRHVQLVVSASRSLLNMPRQQIIDLAVRELAEFFPQTASAKLERAHVVKEVRASFSATPCVEGKRPDSTTSISNLFLAGDWTRSGWPATMEGAVRSGYIAAENVTRFFGQPKSFLIGR
jgi:squalene-associated FAD-dependent desaturase